MAWNSPRCTCTVGQLPRHCAGAEKWWETGKLSRVRMNRLQLSRARNKSQRTTNAYTATYPPMRIESFFNMQEFTCFKTDNVIRWRSIRTVQGSIKVDVCSNGEGDRFRLLWKVQEWKTQKRNIKSWHLSTFNRRHFTTILKLRPRNICRRTKEPI